MVGPHMPWPMMNIALSLPKGPSSCCQITRSIGEAPRPPYSFGQCRQAQPASAFFFCQAFATSRILAPLSCVRPSEDLRSSSSYCLGALALIQLRASARNAASCGVSSKFIGKPQCVRWAERSPPFEFDAVGNAARCPPYEPSFAAPRNDAIELRRVLLAHAVDQRVLPIGLAAKPERERVGTAVIHVTVELPGETHAAMDLDIVLGAMLERLRRADPRGSGGFRQFTGIGRERPGAVIA